MSARGLPNEFDLLLPQPHLDRSPVESCRLVPLPFERLAQRPVAIRITGAGAEVDLEHLAVHADLDAGSD